MFLPIIFLLGMARPSYQEPRHYYIAAVEVDWNYAPTGRDELIGQNFSDEQYHFNANRPDRVGFTYKKALYREYTDATFTVQKPHPEYLGILGPIVRAQVNDKLIIHFKNMATRPYSMHPHGVFYEKESEGAGYVDGTSGHDKDDESVPPGGTYLYEWKVPPRAGPSKGDQPCIAWQYHSHVKSPMGINTGLIGPMIICQRGFLRDDGSRVDVDKEFILIATVVDENLSYYLEDNIETFCDDPSAVDRESKAFIESNKHMTFNGYIYSNLPGLEVCLGDRVVWHMLGMGNEEDVHTITFSGNELLHNGHRRHSYSVSPAIIYSATMRPRHPGTWLIICDVFKHIKAGLTALYTVRDDCGWRPIESPLNGQLREYFIAAEIAPWNYAPSGVNQRDNSSLTDPERAQSKFFESNSERIGGTYLKFLYREYTDGSFSTRKERAMEEEYLGLLGPVIRAEVGDTIRVHFKNMVNRAINLHAGGVVYNKSNEGINYNDGTPGSEKRDGIVIPGTTYVYEWTVPEYIGPTEVDPQCLTHYYRSTLDPHLDLISGLVGPILICKAGTLDENGRQRNVDIEYVLLFTRFDENLSWMINANIGRYAPMANKTDHGFVTSNEMEVINGFSYNNLNGLEACKGDTVSWHLISIGRDLDHHTVYFHGSSFLVDGRREDSVFLPPGTTTTLHVTVENEGLWDIDSLATDHYMDGMQAQYRVRDCTPGGGRVGQGEQERNSIVQDTPMRKYYIAAVEIEWDYAPIRFDPVRNQSLDDKESEGHIFVKRGETTIGSIYKKAVFREFTDGTFQEEKARPIDWGFIGPPVYIEAGDAIEIVFKNLASRPYSLHSHLVKNAEAEQDFHISDDVGVAPGETRTYIWRLPESSEPSDTQGRCEPFIYHSAVDVEKDMYSGLVGPLIACKKESLDENGLRTKVDRELFLLFLVTDENKSWYLQDNINTYCTEPSNVNKDDPDFEESNLMHGINGYIYGNLKGLTMEVGQKVDWYLMGMGTEVDLHTAHFHGQTITYRTENKHRADVFELFPGVTSAVRMVPDSPGEWLLHCHVNDHILGGMETTFIVT